ncbi:hypothetical protein L6452_26370 [Arctium lappa]|uniref:Uncharacterized protein n=1 Tax=Arctium lappa TaxID=4217 RepID=A0ACB9AE03_ARCLA|nr:hypothetical protein L6452_26370 [Arctium lappa]
MIQKTLSTFPTSSIILMNQYRLEYDSKRITTFNKLINLLQVAERHNEVLLNNNARLVGTKKILESNHESVRGGKNSKGRGSKHTDSHTRGNYSSCGRGQGHMLGHGRGNGQGRDNRRGGFSNSRHRDATAGLSNQGKSKGKTPMVDPAKRVREGNEPCYRYGIIGDWYKDFRASNNIAATYKRYRESKENESH